MASYKTQEPFYQDGLRFSCEGCSNCCRYEPGYVFLSRRDIYRLASFLHATYKEITEKYCRPVAIHDIKRLSLKEKQNYDCIFWENNRCSVYKARPLQCKSYPFWPQNLVCRSVWNNLEKECPGVNHGKKYSYRKIEKILHQRKTEPLINIT